MSLLVKKKQQLTDTITGFIKKIRYKMSQLKTEEKIIIFSIIAFTVIMSFFSIMRMYALKSSAWDQVYTIRLCTHLFTMEKCFS